MGRLSLFVAAGLACVAATGCSPYPRTGKIFVLGKGFSVVVRGGRVAAIREPFGPVHIVRESRPEMEFVEVLPFFYPRTTITADGVFIGETRVADGIRETEIVFADCSIQVIGGELAPSEFDRLWQRLRDAAVSGSGMAALWCQNLLAALPYDSVPQLRDHLLGRQDAAEIARLVADLDSEDYHTREAADQALAGMGKAAEPALREGAGTSDSPELRDRVEQLLQRLKEGETEDPEVTRRLWSVMILERIATPEARAVLDRLGRTDPDPRVRSGATGASERLGSGGAR